MGLGIAGNDKDNGRPWVKYVANIHGDEPSGRSVVLASSALGLGLGSSAVPADGACAHTCGRHVASML